MQRPILSPRALNRAFLQRQMLLQRRDLPAEGTIEHLVGMQAQEPQAPYIGLWARIERFRPEELSGLIADHRAVRTGLMRSTIHIVSACDCATLWPLMAPVLARNFRGSQFSKAIAGVDIDELLRYGRELIAQQPRTRAELGPLLADRWPGFDPVSLANAVSLLTPIVQVPPRGLWRQSGQARWTTAEAWLARELGENPSLSEVILRYLAAFGPATVNDIQAWCGLTRLRDVTYQLKDQLHTLADENGRELLDVPDGPLPDPDTPAPPRFLASFDNAILAHHDRSRIIAPQHRPAIYTDRLMRTFLLDGFVAGTWRIDNDTLLIKPIAPLHKNDRSALTDEAERLLAFAAPDASRHNIQIAAA